MPLIDNTPSGVVTASLTRLGRRRMLEDGGITISRFRFFDPEINYKLLDTTPTVDVDDPDITMQSVFNSTDNDLNGDFDFTDSKGKGTILNNPYFVLSQQTLVGNRLVDNPFYAQSQNLVINISALSGSSDFSQVFSSGNSATGQVASPNTFFNVQVNVSDENGSTLNGSVVSLYANNSFVQSITVADTTNIIFNNLSANQDYKVNVTESGYVFKNIVNGVSNGSPYALFSSIENNGIAKFIGYPTTYGGTTYSISGTLTNGITSAPAISIPINIHYLDTSVSASTDGSGKYTFAGLSSGTQYFLSVNSNAWYNDANQSATGTTTANMQNNITIFPRSDFSGFVYYNGTTNPISNVVVNLYQGVSGGTTNKYISSVVSDQVGAFLFPNVILQYAYNINAALNGYSFVNTPLQYGASSVTGSLSGITIYGLKDERPVIPDTPFPFRRRDLLVDNSDFPIFYDTCSWAFLSLKNGILGYATTYDYSPISFSNVLKSTDYTTLIPSLEGPFTFQWNSQSCFTDSFGNISSTTYISDSYSIKVALYAMDYLYSLQLSLPQWDTSSKTDSQIGFPQQLNSNATNIILSPGATSQVTELIPQLDNQQLAINLNSVNNLVSLLPQNKTPRPIVIDSINAVPNIGLYLSHSFNIDPSILNIQLTPFELATNPDYVQYTSVQGEERQIPMEVIVNSFQEVSSSTVQNAIQTTPFSVNGNPLPIFFPVDQLFRNGLLQNNLRSSFGLSDLMNAIRTRGMVFNRVIQWAFDSATGYNASQETAYVTISTVGSSLTDDQILFTVNGTFYTVSQEFSQFLIQYLGIPATDQATINAVLQGNGLVDWLFYIYLVNFGSFYNSYNDGSLKTLLAIGKYVRYAILIDVIVSGKGVAEVINDFSIRQYQPSTNALTILNQTATASNSNAAQVSSAQTIAQAVTNNTGASAVNGMSNGGVTAPGNTATGFNNALPTINSTGFNNALPTINSNGFNNALPTINQQQVVQQGQAHTSVNVSTVTSNYSFIATAMANAIVQNTINFVLKNLYNLVSFDYKIAYTIVIKTINQQVVNTSVKQPVQTATVTTKTVTPIICRGITIVNANNYFNANPLIDKKLKMTMSFDLTQSGAQDNFIKMIDYLNARLYTTFLGVEIVDNGKITQNLNASVRTLGAFNAAPLDVQSGFCQNDKIQFMIPLTLGGIVNSSSNVVTSSPQSYNGSGIIKFVPFVPQQGQVLPPSVQQNSVAHIVRIIKLSNVDSSQVQLVNNNIVTGSDYIAFDVLQINNISTVDLLKQVPRFIQVLSQYDYNLTEQDITQLRQVLNNSYNTIAGISYVGAVGPVFANSTAPPLFWNSSLIPWVTGSTPLAMLTSILGTANVKNVGQVISNINEFTVVSSLPTAN